MSDQLTTQVSALSPTSAVALPQADQPSSDWLSRLPDHERRLVIARKQAMETILAAKSENIGAREAAAAMHGLAGFSAASLRNLCRHYRRYGRDDRALVNWSKFPWVRALVEGRSTGKAASRTAIPPEFIEHVGGRYLENHRSMDAAWRDLIRDWKNSWHTGEKFPGYGSARDYWRDRDPRVLTHPSCPSDLPPGWSKNHLRNLVQTWCNITPAEIALARRGTTALRAELPTLHSTRAGLRFGEHLFTDDLHHDLEVFVHDGAPHERPLEVGILDLASAHYGPFVTQPTLPQDDGTKRMLGWDCVKWAFGSWLEQNGLPLDWPIHLHVERGTATVDPLEAKLWHSASDGIINICYTEMQGRYCLAWDEKRVGNFRAKAHLESAWNLHHAYEAALPGYVGKDRDHTPAILTGQRKETLALLKWAAQQPAEVRATLKLPILTYDQFVQERLDIVARINDRTDHQLEGFEKLTTWRPQGTHFDWRPLSALEELPVSAREFVDYNTRLETPTERKHRLKATGRWVACPPQILALVYAARAVKLTVAKGTIHLRRGTTHWHFMADSRAAMAAAGIEDGKEYLVAYNPFDTRACHLLSVDGQRYLDTWLCRSHRRGDKDALAASLAHRVGLQNEVQQKVERLLIASGAIPATEIRRDHNRTLGAGESAGRIEIISASNPASADDAPGRDEPPARPLRDISHRADSNPCESMPPAAPVPLDDDPTSGLTARPSFDSFAAAKESPRRSPQDEGGTPSPILGDGGFHSRGIGHQITAGNARALANAALSRRSQAEADARAERRRAKRLKLLTENETF